MEDKEIEKLDEKSENIEQTSAENAKQASAQITEKASAEKSDAEQKKPAKKINVITGEEVSYSDDLVAKWYVLHTFSGYENVAKENLETVVTKFNLQDRIFDIVIPMEEVVEEKNGKKVLVERKAMPCYILVKMKYADDIWHHVIHTRGITGFVGPMGRPLALTEDEVIKMRLEKIKVETNLAVGDQIEVVEGPLNGMIGQVTAVNKDLDTLTVKVEMFGRETTVELNFGQVRKVNN